MLLRRFPVLVPVATLILSGCAAAPLAQMAATQMASRPACPADGACEAGTGGGSFDDLSRNVSNSFHKFTSLVSDDQPLPPTSPPPPGK